MTKKTPMNLNKAQKMAYSACVELNDLVSAEQVKGRLNTNGLSRSLSQVQTILRSLCEIRDEKGTPLLTKSLNRFTALPPLDSTDLNIISKVSHELEKQAIYFEQTENKKYIAESPATAIFFACFSPRSQPLTVERSMNLLTKSWRAAGIDPQKCSIEQIIKFLEKHKDEELMKICNNRSLTPGNNGLTKIATARRVVNVLHSKFPELNTLEDFQTLLHHQSKGSLELVAQLTHELISINGVGLHTVENILSHLQIELLIVNGQHQKWLLNFAQRGTPLPSIETTRTILELSIQAIRRNGISLTLNQFSENLQSTIRNTKKRDDVESTPIELILQKLDYLLLVGKYLEKLPPDRSGMLVELLEASQKYGVESEEFFTVSCSYLRPEIEMLQPDARKMFRNIRGARNPIDELIGSISTNLVETKVEELS